MILFLVMRSRLGRRLSGGLFVEIEFLGSGPPLDGRMYRSMALGKMIFAV